jgi:hypothetical protein
MIRPNKLYRTQAHTQYNKAARPLLELKGNVSITIYGSKDEYLNLSDLTPQTALLTGDQERSLFALPRYVGFIGTADRINIEGYDLTEIEDIIL